MLCCVVASRPFLWGEGEKKKKVRGQKQNNKIPPIDHIASNPAVWVVTKQSIELQDSPKVMISGFKGVGF